MTARRMAGSVGLGGPVPLGFFPAWPGVGADVAGRHMRALSSARVGADLAMIGLRSDRASFIC
jgi:hypothetical protein